jgi:hypothetical protein
MCCSAVRSKKPGVQRLSRHLCRLFSLAISLACRPDRGRPAPGSTTWTQATIRGNKPGTPPPAIGKAQALHLWTASPGVLAAARELDAEDGFAGPGIDGDLAMVALDDDAP